MNRLPKELWRVLAIGRKNVGVYAPPGGKTYSSEQAAIEGARRYMEQGAQSVEIWYAEPKWELIEGDDSSHRG